MKTELKLHLAIAILTAFSLIVFPGYDVFVLDQLIYIPAIYQSMNPELYQNDLLLSLNLLNYTLFDELIVFLTGVLGDNIFYALFTTTVFIRYLYLYSLFSIAFFLTKDRMFSIFSLVFFISPILINGTEITTIDTYLTPRLISYSFNLLFLALVLSRRRILSTVALGVGLLMHPITSIPFVIFLYLDLAFCLYKNRGPVKECLLSALTPVLFLTLFMLATDSSGLKIFTFIDPAWEEIINERHYGIFISNWVPISFLFLIVSACFFMVSRRELKEVFEDATKRRYCLMLFFIPLFLTVLSFITVDIFKLHFFAQLQMARSLFLWKIFNTLLFSRFAYEYIKRHPKDLLYNFSLVGTVSPLAFPLYYVIRVNYTEPLILFFLPIFLVLWIGRKHNLLVTDQPLIIRKFYISFLVLIICLVSLSSIFSKEQGLVFSDLVLAILLVSSIIPALVSWKRDYIFGNKSPYVFCILLAASATTFFPGLNIYPFYLKHSPLAQASAWIEKNTDEDDIFMTRPFTLQGPTLRLTSRRNVFTTYKDGQLVFNRDFAFEWKKRIEIVKNLYHESDKGPVIARISEEYGVGYIISEEKLDLGYPPEYKNTEFFIYKIK